MKPLEYDVVDDLRNICVNITMLQAICDIPIFAKMVSEFCFKKLWRKRKYLPTIYLVGECVDVINVKNLVNIYIDPSNPIILV